MSEGNVLAIVKAAQNKGALVFANIENMETKVDLYRTEVTEIAFRESDFHIINGKSMPNKASTDRIGEACGIQFIQAACRVIAETRDDTLCGKRTVYRGEAQGKIRMPDGSWRNSTVDEYEFDPVLRAMLDKNVTELNEKTMQMVGRTILEYTKVARQRAATGARSLSDFDQNTC
jgi:electron transfer flavoprotein alpha subunit